ncbi:MAG: ferredoxin--NADP(+) reductase [Methylophaga sp.]|jgi:ferredoxin-NADP reductase|uniref:PDR/VanB family oxidoreductase n=2 Tax=unclassified Methylophaga TaxID=2629249 RepID=UPI000C67F636|nr:PDR/VanB family oxidoreductase [Methylophaga sp. UBA678]MAX52455.1 ferredoxin--NADP(+) reductase [Methylophaga sp.]|tara:strand:- start:119985 stop:120938 length:954 start_codon:yes stop_codon:yes gene_type:complete
MSVLNVTVEKVEQITDVVKRFTFVQDNGEALPKFSGGSHVVVSMDINGRTHRNPYSLMSSPANTDSYQIAVRRQDKSRGGSVFMHDQVKPGTKLTITYPVNLFAINRLGKKHILVAGGIGITPFMSQIADLNRLGADYELHYAYRSSEHAAFREQLEELCGDRVHFYVEGDGTRIDFGDLLGQQPLGTHAYVCGPEPMVKMMLLTAKYLGWPSNHVHSEQFLAPPVGDEFTVVLNQSAKEIVVPGDMSMLEAMEEAGVDAPFLCRGGACGRCELDVLETDGALLHHDHYLSDAEKAAGNKIMPCVSRAKCTRLVVNL